MWVQIFKILAAEISEAYGVNYREICCLKVAADRKAADFISILAKIIPNKDLNRLTVPVQQLLLVLEF